MRADFWLYAFSITFCKFNGYTKEGKDKGDKAGWRSRGSGIGVWIFLFYPLPPSLWGYQKAGKVWGSQREAKALKPPVKLLPSVAISPQALAMPCSSHSEGSFLREVALCRAASRWAGLEAAFPSTLAPGWRVTFLCPYLAGWPVPRNSLCLWRSPLLLYIQVQHLRAHG